MQVARNSIYKNPHNDIEIEFKSIYDMLIMTSRFKLNKNVLHRFVENS